MSVIHFDSIELGRLAGYLATKSGPLGSQRWKQSVASHAETLAKVSEANTKAYNASYCFPARTREASSEAEACTAAHIAAEAKEQMLQCSHKNAKGTVVSLAYNCTSQNGEDFLLRDPETMRAVLAMVTMFLWD